MAAFLSVDEHSVRFPVVGLDDGTTSVIWRASKCVVAYRTIDSTLIIVTRDGIQFRVMKRSPSSPQPKDCLFSRSSHFSKFMMVHHVSEFLPNVLWVLEGSYRMWMITADGTCCCVGMSESSSVMLSPEGIHNAIVTDITEFVGVRPVTGCFSGLEFVFEGRVFFSFKRSTDEREDYWPRAWLGQKGYSLMLPFKVSHKIPSTNPHADPFKPHLPYDRHFLLQDGSELPFCNALWSCISEAIGAELVFGASIPKQSLFISHCDSIAARVVIDVVTKGLLKLERVQDVPSVDAITEVLDLLLVKTVHVKRFWAAVVSNLFSIVLNAKPASHYSLDDLERVLQLMRAPVDHEQVGWIVAIMAFHNVSLGAHGFGLMDSNMQNSVVITCAGEDGVDPPVMVQHDFLLSKSHVVRFSGGHEACDQSLVGVVRRRTNHGSSARFTFTLLDNLTVVFDGPDDKDLVCLVFHTLKYALISDNFDLEIAQSITTRLICDRPGTAVAICSCHDTTDIKFQSLVTAAVDFSVQTEVTYNRLLVLVACSMRKLGILPLSTEPRSTFLPAEKDSATIIPASKIRRTHL